MPVSRESTPEAQKSCVRSLPVPSVSIPRKKSGTRPEGGIHRARRHGVPDGGLSREGRSPGNVVFNRTASKAGSWLQQYQGSGAATPAEAADGAEIVFCCVGNDDDVREVVSGENGALGGMSEGSILVDHTTASATLAREMYTAAANVGVGFLDAPLSGGQAGAESGQLTIMVGGGEATYSHVRVPRLSTVMRRRSRTSVPQARVNSPRW